MADPWYSEDETEGENEDETEDENEDEDEYEDNPYVFTATGYLGDKRPAMLSNPLLQKSRVGVANPRDMGISRDTVFGGKFRDPFTAAHALSGWPGQKSHAQDEGKHEKQCSDYLQLYRTVESWKRVTLSELRLFRRAKMRNLHKELSNEKGPVRMFLPSDVSGRPNLYDENIAELIAHGYQKNWLRRIKEERKPTKVKETIKFKVVRANRASMLRPRIVPTEIRQQPWRSPAFLKKAEPRISTFRTKKLANDARNAQAFESSGRFGDAGQGVDKTTVHDHYYSPFKEESPMDTQDSV